MSTDGGESAVKAFHFPFDHLTAIIRHLFSWDFVDRLLAIVKNDPRNHTNGKEESESNGK